MNSQVEAVLFQLVILHLILDALIGTGMLKPALLVLNSGFSVQENAREFHHIATLTLMLLVSALAASKATDLTMESVKLPLLKVLFANPPTMLDLA
jgi:hypothetical protein